MTGPDMEAVNAANAPLPDEMPLPTTPTEEAKPEAAKDDPKPETKAEEPADDEGDDENPSDEGGDTDAGDAPKKRQRPGKWARTVQRQQATIDALSATVEALKRGDGASEPATKQQATELKEPRQEDFQSYEDFVVAKAEHKLAAKAAEQKAAAERDASERTQAEKQKAFASQLDAARDRYEDFDDVVFSKEANIPAHVAEALLDSEKGADLAYHLASNPDEAKRIAAMTPTKAAIELGRLEAKLSAPAPKKTTAAPPPAKTLKGSDVVRKDPSAMSPSEYRAWREGGGGR